MTSAALLAVAGCSSAAPTLSWASVPLPGNATAVTLTTYHEELLVGTQDPGDGGRPGAVTVRQDATTPVRVTSASGYGAEGRWLSVAADDTGGLVGVAGARGGAHANVRWTVWRGSTATGLIEEPQTFETFGGWGAGDLVGAVAPSSGPVVVGSWESRGAGQDAAVWLPTASDKWVRQDSAGTPLASTPDELVGVVSAAADESRLLLSGSLLRLGDTTVRQAPVVWRSAAGATGWSRLELPGPGRGEATGAVCAAGTCTVVGRLEGRVAVWRVTGEARRLDAVPDVAVGDADPLPSPALTTAGAVLAVPSGTASQLLRESAGRWTTLPGPPGPVRALAVVGTRAYAVAADSGGVDRLWAADL